MIEKLFKLGYFDYQKFIIDNIRLLNLNGEEALLMIKVLDQFNIDGKMHITELENSLNMNNKKIQEILSALMEKDFYEIFLSYNNGVGEEFITVTPFFNKVEILLDKNEEKPSDEIIPSVLDFLEREMQRVLSATEQEVVISFVKEDGYKFNDIEQAVALCKKKHRVLSMKNITMMLASLDANISNNNEEIDQNTIELKSIYKMMAKK